MPELINRETGEVETFADADVPAAIASHRYLAPATNAIAVHRFGADTYATPEQVAQESPLIARRIDPGKAEIAAGHHAREEAEGGIGGTLRAIAGAGISSLSFGTVNPWEESQEFHPLAAGAAGLVAPFLIPGAESAFLRDAEGAEHAVGAMSSKMLYAGEHGAEGLAGKAERALMKSGEGAEHGGAAEMSESQLAKRQLADDIAAHRSDLAQRKVHLAWEGGARDAEGNAVDGVSKLGKRTLDADRGLDKMIDNPYAFADHPERAMPLLQKQQAAFEELLGKEESLRKAYAADTSGTRAAALDYLPQALERNKGLQERIRALAEAGGERGGEEGGFIGKLLEGKVFHHAEEWAKEAIPVPWIGPMLGAKAAELAKDLVFGNLGHAVGHSVGLSADAVKAFLSTPAGAAAIGMSATAVLSKVRFGSEEKSEGETKERGERKEELRELFEKRAAEVRSHTQYNAAGKAEITPAANEKLASRFDAIRQHDPVAADKVETVARNRIEHLSNTLPRSPDAPTLGPSKMGPSDMEMRGWAMRVRAAEHPEIVEQRLASGTITPSEAETHRTIYPERHAAVVQKIVAGIQESGKAPSYQKRIALSIFTGQAMDPALQPAILRVFQSQFSEPGTKGGTQQPTAQPQFGSIKKSVESPTGGQSREAGVHAPT